ncbi:MAG TPA: small basic family protein [Bacillota bacterium]|nr:small basic family protein [Bacillota bacterium]HPE38876.1 small basic family protein [Bacillota bacterium]
MIIPLIGLILGLIIGLLIGYDIPSAYSTYIAILILTMVDSLMGAIVADMRGRFKTRLFVTGVLGNALVALALTALGEQLGLPLYYAAIFAFGNRIFVNFSKLRRIFLHKIDEKNAANAKSVSSDSHENGDENADITPLDD